MCRFWLGAGLESVPSFVTMFRNALGTSPGRYMASVTRAKIKRLLHSAPMGAALIEKPGTGAHDRLLHQCDRRRVLPHHRQKRVTQAVTAVISRSNNIPDVFIHEVRSDRGP